MLRRSFVVLCFFLYCAFASQRIFNRDGSVSRIVPLSGRDTATNTTFFTVAKGKMIANGWTEVDLGRAIVHALSFSWRSGKFGCIAGEQGVIFVTNDSGSTWKQTKSGSSTHYYYGAQAFSDDKTCFVTGFSDPPQSGIYTMTKDAGKKWSQDQYFSTGNWMMQVQFSTPKYLTGIVPTMTGADFVVVKRDPKKNEFILKTRSTGASGWFAQSAFSFVGANANVTGVNWCSTTDNGAAWTCKPGVDPSGDGGVFINGSIGLVGGGDISPSVTGWVHVSSDGGNTWGSRISFPYPIRYVGCLNEKLCIASGGNYFSNVGGLWLSQDSGATWKLDLIAGAELESVSIIGGTVFAAGSSGSLGGKVFNKKFF